MKELLKSLPWLRFLAMVLISCAAAWLVMHLTGYVWWFATGTATYMLASIITFGLFGLDTVSVATLLVDYDDAFETFYGDDASLLNDAARCMDELKAYARKHHKIDLEMEHKRWRLAQHAETNVVQLFKRS